MKRDIAELEHSLASSVREIAESFLPRMKEIRRYLHRRPELSEQEFETTQFVCELVDDLGMQAKLAQEKRGLTVDIDSHGDRGEASPHRVAVRGDLDALPIQTRSTAEYASRHDGMMHACGHDAHTAIVWGVMAILNELQNNQGCASPFRVRGIFQPAEETSTGGKHMIASGALEQVDSALALHVDPTRLVGTIGVRDGAFTAGCDSFNCSFYGKGGHSARPHLTTDTAGAMADWINSVYRRVPRVADSLDSVVVNVGRLECGSTSNVIPSDGELAGTLRSLTMSSSRAAMAQMQLISDAIATTYGCEVHLKFRHHTPPVVNHPLINAELTSAARQIVGHPSVRTIERPSMGAEDFAFIANEIPSAMMRLGIAGLEVGSEPLHTPQFDLDEQSLSVGAATLALAAIRLCQLPLDTSEPDLL